MSSNKSPQRVHCPACAHTFENNSGSAGKVVGTAGGAVLGAKIGAGVGLALGPLGAISGMLPGAVIGGLAGMWTGNKVADRCKCPKCSQTFEV
jgi:phage tail tape-measure protein